MVPISSIWKKKTHSHRLFSSWSFCFTYRWIRSNLCQVIIKLGQPILSMMYYFIRDFQNKKVMKNMRLVLFVNYEFFKICITRKFTMTCFIVCNYVDFPYTRQILINWKLDSLMSDICLLVCNIFRVQWYNI